jgi:hypothetical protein
MGGGLTQLVLKGQLDEYINVNPDISFYKYAYKRHTNFSMESIRLNFDTAPVITNNNTIYRCKINRLADLLSNTYLIFTLPDIYSNDKYRFKWVEHVATQLIKKITITIGATVIDNLTGEFLLILNELSLLTKDNYNKLTGNVPDFIEPKITKPIIRINNNRFSESFYPEGSKELNIPSIKSREIIIPLPFWFTKNPSLALQILRLQGEETYINLELENIENLYQVYSNDLEMYISPTYYNDLYSSSKININTFIKTTNLNAYIEANYIYLDNDERLILMGQCITRLLIEQTFISNNYSITSGDGSSTTIELMGANTHIKEIFWTLKRDDYHKYNTNLNYTNLIPENKDNPILKSAIIYLNKNINRIEDKEANYYNILQPYQHHTSIPKQGIYCYSFGIFPEKWQPTGSYNAASVTTSLCLYVNGGNNDLINEKLIKFNKQPYNYNYEVKYYIKGYNVIEFNSGVASLKYI